MKTIIMATSFALFLTGCGDSTQFSGPSGKNPQSGQAGKKVRDFSASVENSGENDDSSDRFEDGSIEGLSQEGLIPSSKSNQTLGSSEGSRSQDGMTSASKTPETAENLPSQQAPKSPSDQKKAASVKEELAFTLPSMIASQDSSLNKAQQNALEVGLVEISAGLLENPAATGAALSQLIDLTKKVNSFKGASNLATSSALAGPIPLNLPVDLPALADAAVLADIAAAIGDLAAAAAALDVAGIVAALQDIIAAILDLIA